MRDVAATQRNPVCPDPSSVGCSARIVEQSDGGDVRQVTPVPRIRAVRCVAGGRVGATSACFIAHFAPEPEFLAGAGGSDIWSNELRQTDSDDGGRECRDFD